MGPALCSPVGSGTSEPSSGPTEALECIPGNGLCVLRLSARVSGQRISEGEGITEHPCPGARTLPVRCV